MLKYSESKVKKKYFKLRLASLKDSKFLLELYNSNVAEKNYFSKNKIFIKDHVKWLNEKLKYKMLFICISRYRVGYIRYDNLNKNNLSVSIAVKEKYKRRGFGKLMLKNSIRKKHIGKFFVYAFIKEANLISKNFFLSNGFVRVRKNTYKYKPEK